MHPVGVVEHPLLGAAHDPRAPLEADRRPTGLGFAADGGELGQRFGAEHRNGRDQLAGRGILDSDRSAVAPLLPGFSCCSTLVMSGLLVRLCGTFEASDRPAPGRGHCGASTQSLGGARSKSPTCRGQQSEHPEPRRGSLYQPQPVLSGVELDRLDRRRIERPVLGTRRQRLDRIDGVHPGGHPAEHRVLAVEPRRARRW